jgi:hypothetical protein
MFPFRGYITQKRRKRFSCSFKETMALKLGFHKEDGVGKSYRTDATNASFLFLLDLVGKHAHYKCITNAITESSHVW